MEICINVTNQLASIYIPLAVVTFVYSNITNVRGVNLRKASCLTVDIVTSVYIVNRKCINTPAMLRFNQRDGQPCMPRERFHGKFLIETYALCIGEIDIGGNTQIYELNLSRRNPPLTLFHRVGISFLFFVFLRPG